MFGWRIPLNFGKIYSKICDFQGKSNMYVTQVRVKSIFCSLNNLKMWISFHCILSDLFKRITILSSCPLKVLLLVLNLLSFDKFYLLPSVHLWITPPHPLALLSNRQLQKRRRLIMWGSVYVDTNRIIIECVLVLMLHSFLHFYRAIHVHRILELISKERNSPKRSRTCYFFSELGLPVQRCRLIDIDFCYLSRYFSTCLFQTSIRGIIFI